MKFLALFTYTALVSASAFTIGSAMTERDMLRYVPTAKERADLQTMRDAERTINAFALPVRGQIASAPDYIIEWRNPAPARPAKEMTIESLIAEAH